MLLEQSVKGSLKISNDIIFYEAAEKETGKRMQSLIPVIENRIRPEVSSIILKALSDSPTVQSLNSGKLKDDFGLFGNVANVTIVEITKYISENIKISINQSRQAGSVFKLAIDIPAGDKNLIKITGGSIPAKGGPVNWLEWLLTRGTQVVIGDFWLFPHARGKTRSGGNSVMVEIKTTPHEPFRVDPNFAGTLEDNFITRSIESVGEEILNVAAVAFSRSM